MNEGVRIKDLTGYERFIRFKHKQSYVVPAGQKHQIVHNKKQDDIGIAVSRNGRKDFRQCKENRVYWFTGPYAYITEVPMTSQGITIDLSRLV